MYYSFVLYFAFFFTYLSCTEALISMEEDHYNTQIFDEFWTFVDEHYIYFDVKGVDWSQVKDRYRQQVTEDMTEAELYHLCHAALSELQDGHNRIQAPDYYKRSYDVRQNYNIQFSWTVIKERYITRPIEQKGYVYATILENNIGYIYLPLMSKYGSMSETIRNMKADGIRGLILDVRNNMGGDSNPLLELLGDFVQEETTLGYYIEKRGPGHRDVTEPLAAVAVPSGDFYLDLPVVVITNRASYSATSYLAAMFRQVPNVTLVGQKTGGGGGGNYGYQLSNEWVVAVSVSDFLTPEMRSIEPGVAPDIEIENSAERLEQGIDDMLQMAIDVIMHR